MRRIVFLWKIGIAFGFSLISCCKEEQILQELYLESPRQDERIEKGSPVVLEWAEGEFYHLSEYDVYLSSTNPPTDRVARGLSTRTHVVRGLASGSYYWKVVALSGDGRGHVSPVRRFWVTRGGSTVSGSPVAITWVKVKGGTFYMGNKISGVVERDELPSHRVVLSDFFMSSREITNQQYAQFLNQLREGQDYYVRKGVVFGASAKGWLLLAGGINYKQGRFEAGGATASLPVVNVSWEGAMAFADNLNARLPTEAEWEFSARGGVSSKGYIYSGSNLSIEVGWTTENAFSSQKVGGRKANEIGLYDMSGNVWEWCYDWYKADYYSVSPIHSPMGWVIGKKRSIRGGSYDLPPFFSRVANRGAMIPTGYSKDVGFRIAKKY